MLEYFVRAMEHANHYKRVTRDIKEILKLHYLKEFSRIDIYLAEQCLTEFNRMIPERQWNPFFILIAHDKNSTSADHPILV